MTKEVKFSKEEIENSKRIFKSATPKQDLSWYIKWVASIVMLFAMSMRGIPEFAIWDGVLSIFGLFGWLIVAMLWKDRALILLNAVGLVLVTRNVIESLL